MARPARQQAERDGRRAERIAAWYLRLKGWRVLDERVRTPRGEIDLIVRRGRIVAFVEVKRRPDQAQLMDAIARPRLARVAAAASGLAARYARHGEDVRIDAILLAPGRWPIHLTNIWHDHLA